MKYIDSDKLITEIERRIDSWSIRGKNSPVGQGKDTCESRVTELSDLLSFIITLQQEQREVDLEEYIENEIKHYGLSLYEASYGTFSASEIDRIMRKFYELGLKARKV